MLDVRRINIPTKFCFHKEMAEMWCFYVGNRPISLLAFLR